MTIAKHDSTTKLMTLEAYLDYDDGTDTRYELVDGVLTEMGAESEINAVIESFLFSIFLQFVPYYCIRCGNTELVVEGRHANTRFPDLTVLTEAGIAALSGSKRSIVLLDMPAPVLVVEVVSSSDTDRASRDRDYIHKRKEYEQRGIPEYWIVDPVAGTVLVMQLVEGRYVEEKYQGSQKLVSEQFSSVELSAEKIIKAGL